MVRECFYWLVLVHFIELSCFIDLCLYSCFLFVRDPFPHGAFPDSSVLLEFFAIAKRIVSRVAGSMQRNRGLVGQSEEEGECGEFPPPSLPSDSVLAEEEERVFWVPCSSSLQAPTHVHDCSSKPVLQLQKQSFWGVRRVWSNNEQEVGSTPEMESTHGIVGYYPHKDTY